MRIGGSMHLIIVVVQRAVAHHQANTQTQQGPSTKLSDALKHTNALSYTKINVSTHKNGCKDAIINVYGKLSRAKPG